MPDLRPGQKLWFVPSRRPENAHKVEVVSVARKWATLNGNNGRVDKRTLIVDGGDYSSPGHCYLSREHYESEMVANTAWHELLRKLAYGKPPGMTIEAIREVARLCGIEFPDA